MGPQTAKSLELPNELYATGPVRRLVSVSSPFLALAGYAFFSLRESWAAAFFCVVWFSFVSYGSTSHDLVHRCLGLPPFWNRFFLHAIERLALRSGHAYQLAHLNHHRRFPERDDIEGRAIHDSLAKFIAGVPLQQFKVWGWAWRRPDSQKLPLLLDAVWFVGFLTASFVFRESLPQLGFYAVLVIAGSWAIPFVTVLLPHRPEGGTPEEYTRLFRGRLFDWIFFRHLYHLEHHLFPAVPHHNWKKLGSTLDPYFTGSGIPVVRAPF